MSNEQETDQNLFATSCIPLTLKSSSKGEIIWQTPCAASIRLCRPISLKYATESKKLIIETEKNLQEQIAAIRSIDYPLQIGVRSVTIKPKFYMTLIDGKVFAILNDTSMQSCPICKRKPSQFNNESVWNTNQTDKKALNYGISPLHLWIRLFECVLHTGYKKVGNNDRGGQTQEVKENKAIIQARFLNLFNMRVDFPNPKGGNSNTGNVARRAFADPELFAKCLGFEGEEVEIIRMLRNVLLCFSCQLPINTDKFREYCKAIFDLWMHLFPWFKMTPTLHKLLCHGEELIKASPLPLGMLTEEGAESKHKIYRSDGLHHARQSSRIKNLTDIFHRSLEFSDPFFSLKIMEKSKQKAIKVLPRDVLQLLDFGMIGDLNDVPIDSAEGFEDEISQLMSQEDLEEFVLETETNEFVFN
ncbi:hypothetical protein PVAND_012140 [Polypedilum vanderplanki]|uniref:Uncharacterized protein n=1 Tax=Polypedilum vanderplanki TaxID=319348 RepID=A0A9J6CMH9_POLVA|nr:hypothetical protein PVAND_012140 [Polypedilum vanderplanki]